MAKPKVENNRLGLVMCGTISRLLKTVRGLNGNVYVVGGLVTEGATLRDIDIVISSTADIPKIKKALGTFAPRAHFLLQKGQPPAPIFLQVTGKEPVSLRKPLEKGKRVPKNEYAN